MLQVSYFVIDNFRQWTEHPLKEEGEIQRVQSRIGNALLDSLYQRDALLLSNRGDAYLALTNGLPVEEHRFVRRIEERCGHRLRAGVGYGPTLYAAQQRASEAYHRLLPGQLVAGEAFDAANPLVMLQVDVDGFTKMVQAHSPLVMEQHLLAMRSRLSNELSLHGSAAFFLSGDNYLAPIPPLPEESVEELLRMAEGDLLSLKAGIGTASTPRRAAHLSGLALKCLREEGYVRKVYSVRES